MYTIFLLYDMEYPIFENRSFIFPWKSRKNQQIPNVVVESVEGFDIFAESLKCEKTGKPRNRETEKSDASAGVVVSGAPLALLLFVVFVVVLVFVLGLWPRREEQEEVLREQRQEKGLRQVEVGPKTELYKITGLHATTGSPNTVVCGYCEDWQKWQNQNSLRESDKNYNSQSGIKIWQNSNKKEYYSVSKSSLK